MASRCDSSGWPPEADHHEHVGRHRDRVWLATTGQIARHFAGHVPIDPA